MAGCIELVVGATRKVSSSPSVARATNGVLLMTTGRAAIHQLAIEVNLIVKRGKLLRAWEGRSESRPCAQSSSAPYAFKKNARDQLADWCAGWYRSSMATAKKVTVELPTELLQRAQEFTGQGVTSTIRRGLELLAASRAYDELLKLKGKVKISVDMRAQREDRS